MEVKKALQKIRKAKGYSQQKIAEYLKTTQQQYSKYETGDQEIPVRHIITLCELYKISANKLLGIETFVSEQEEPTKFQKLYEIVEEIITWAVEQDHITDDAACILLRNIYREKQRIEEE